ncbi:cysteine proteinase inhibitor A [Lactuca sativa]|uniref:cysteine proteinase inhibitor A n=1 Tax=Lactuca sativa TaxID=4236 RepID=UPI000CB8E99E|nr:cysteine proteinase inhibitor A [Lactuca sativa]
MRHLFVTILIFFLPFLYNFSFALCARTLAGSWTPINASDPMVIEIGKFAVDEHDKDDHMSLQFEKVVAGESQVVAGTQYNITITAVEGGVENNYVALVWDKPWQKFRELMSFVGPV